MMNERIIGSDANRMEDLKAKAEVFDKMNINPTVDVRDVIALIRAHYDNDETGFKAAAREIAVQLERQGNLQLELYIKSILGDTPTWVPMDEITTDINLKAQLHEIEKLTELLDVPNSDGQPVDRIPQFAVSHSRVAVHIRRTVKRCLQELGDEEEKGKDDNR